MTPLARQTHDMRPKTTSHDKGKVMKEMKVLQKVFLEAYREPENLKTLDQVKQFWKDERNNLKDQHTFRSRLNLMLKKERTYVPHEVHLSGVISPLYVSLNLELNQSHSFGYSIFVFLQVNL